MNKLMMVLMMTLISFTTYSQTVGVSANSSELGAGYGFYIEDDDNKFGFEYQKGATINSDPLQVEQYLNGEIDSYTAGSSFYNIGAYWYVYDTDRTKFLFGLGTQTETEFTTRGDVKSMHIYSNIGFKYQLDKLVSFKASYQHAPHGGIDSIVIGMGFDL